MPFTVQKTDLDGVVILEPRAFPDHRGEFYESFNARDFEAATGVADAFVQDNHVRSVKGALRGLHVQDPHPQGKLVRAVAGSIWDVAVDVRRGSATFGKHVAVELSAANRRQLWVPAGFAHGYLAMTDCEVIYKTTDYWYPVHEQCIVWNDPALGIQWPVSGTPILSPKDAAGKTLSELENRS